MADTTDLKSVGEHSPCRFEFRPVHHFRQKLYFMNIEQQPNPKIHFYISLVKSCLRIFAGITLVNSLFVATGVLFIVAEVLGILEEVF